MINNLFYSTLLLMIYLLILSILKLVGVNENILGFLFTLTPLLTIFIVLMVSKINLKSNYQKIYAPKPKFFPRINN